METLIMSIPVFNERIAVEGYHIRFHKGNIPAISSQAEKSAISTTYFPSLEILNSIGIETFSTEKPVFVPISGFALLGDLEEQCNQDPKKIIFLLDADAKSEEPYISNMRKLKEKGFRFAFSGIQNVSEYNGILMHADFIFVNTKMLDMYQLDTLIKTMKIILPNLKIVASHVDSMEQFNKLRVRHIHFFEGRFYRKPLPSEQKRISTIKANLVQLLNYTHNENFEFSEITRILQYDLALTVSLLKLINSAYFGLTRRIESIDHALTLLGQEELRKWISISVSRMLFTDKPTEIVRLSLLRAKFAENLARLFRLEAESAKLFLMGMVSVLNIALDISINEIPEVMIVSDDIQDVLVKQTGKYEPVMSFIKYYEQADWPAIMRAIIINDLIINDINRAYIETLIWYRGLFAKK